MGGDIIPSFVSQGDASVYDFTANSVPGSTDRDRAYWRDVGTIDAYHEAHMDLVSIDPVFNLYNNEWPIWTYPVQMPGAKFTLRGLALDSIVSAGCIVSGGSIESRCCHPNVRVDGGRQGRPGGDPDQRRDRPEPIVRRAILDKNVHRSRAPPSASTRRPTKPRLHRLRQRDHRRRQGSQGQEG